MPEKKTHEHYLKQKSQTFAHFRVAKDDLAPLSSSQFTIFDFISHCFSFSNPRKQVAADVLNELKKGPASFKELQERLSAKKSSLFLVLLALERAGLVERKGKSKPFELSGGFSGILRAYAGWWESWRE